MLRDGVVIGVFAMWRSEIRPFTDKQIDLVMTFADQAVIAIENVRLFTELQEKNRALTQAHAQVIEALEQQTATSEVLRVISSSPTDIRPVIDTVAASSARLCEAQDTHIYLVDGEVLRLAAHYGSLPSGVVGESTLPVIRGTLNGRSSSAASRRSPTSRTRSRSSRRAPLSLAATDIVRPSSFRC
jgi:hypothetical protein